MVVKISELSFRDIELFYRITKKFILTLKNNNVRNDPMSAIQSRSTMKYKFNV